MEEKIKDPRCLIDAEALASHVSMYTSPEVASRGNEGDTTVKKGGKKGKKPKQSGGADANSSASQLKQSESEASTSKISDKSASNTTTQAGQRSSETSWPSNKVSYVNIELPDSIAKAIRIIERLLT